MACCCQSSEVLRTIDGDAFPPRALVPPERLITYMIAVQRGPCFFLSSCLRRSVHVLQGVELLGTRLSLLRGPCKNFCLVSRTKMFAHLHQDLPFSAPNVQDLLPGHPRPSRGKAAHNNSDFLPRFRPPGILWAPIQWFCERTKHLSRSFPTVRELASLLPRTYLIIADWPPLAFRACVIFLCSFFFSFRGSGFDAHENDPLAGIALDEEDYHWVTREICAVAGKVCCMQGSASDVARSLERA